MGSAAEQKGGKLSQIQMRHTNGSFLIAHHQNKSWSVTTWGHAGQPPFQIPSILCCAVCLRPWGLQTPRLGNIQPAVTYSWPCCSRAKHFQPRCKSTSCLSSSGFWLLQAAFATTMSDRSSHPRSLSVYCCSSCILKVTIDWEMEHLYIFLDFN